MRRMEPLTFERKRPALDDLTAHGNSGAHTVLPSGVAVPHPDPAGFVLAQTN